jgi:short-subunit dehydrogenase
MLERRRGGIVVMTSGAAMAGSGFNASYHASKAFDLVLGESLWSELAPHGIDVLSVIAGPTNTPHALSTGLDFSKVATPVMEADDVVRESLEHLTDGPSWIPGESNREMLAALQTTPRRAIVEAMSAMNKALFGG